MFPGLHVSVENTANAECTFFFFYFIGIKAYGRFLFLIHARIGRRTREDAWFLFKICSGRGGVMHRRIGNLMRVA